MPIGAGDISMEARFAVARLGAFRLGAFSFAQFVEIGGSAVSVARIMPGTKITHVLGQKSSAELKILPVEGSRAIYGEAIYGIAIYGGGIIPAAAGQEVTIAFGGPNLLEFGGHITKVTEKPRGTNRFQYDLTCSDYSHKLAKRKVNAVYGSMLSSAMAQDLIENHTDPTDGITFNALSAGNVIDGRVFNEVDLGDALNWVARQDGASYRMTPSKQVRWWYGQETGVQSPTAISVSNTSYESVQGTPSNIQQIRTRIRVRGSKTVLTSAAAAGATSISVEDTSLLPSSGSVKIGADEVTYTGKTSTTLTGIPPSGTGSIANAWPSGTDVHMLVIVNDSSAQSAIAAIEGGDGIHEDLLTDESLTSVTAATEAGTAELAKYAPIVSTAKIGASVDRFMQVGRQVELDLPHRALVGTYLIQKVTISFAGPQRAVRDVDLGPYRTDLEDLLIRQTLPRGA